MLDNPTITELSQNQANLSTLVSALGEAGLDETLNDEDATFTVFAPTNGAFENVDVDELTGNSEHRLDEPASNPGVPHASGPPRLRPRRPALLRSFRLEEIAIRETAVHGLPSLRGLPVPTRLVSHC